MMWKIVLNEYWGSHFFYSVHDETRKFGDKLSTFEFEFKLDLLEK